MEIPSGLTGNSVVHILAQLAFERTMGYLLSIGADLQQLSDKTLEFTVAQRVHAMFDDFHDRGIFPSNPYERGSLRSDLSQSLYHPVRDEVVQKLQSSV